MTFFFLLLDSASISTHVHKAPALKLIVGQQELALARTVTTSPSSALGHSTACLKAKLQVYKHATSPRNDSWRCEGALGVCLYNDWQEVNPNTNKISDRFSSRWFFFSSCLMHFFRNNRLSYLFFISIFFSQHTPKPTYRCSVGDGEGGETALCQWSNRFPMDKAVPLCHLGFPSLALILKLTQIELWPSFH